MNTDFIKESDFENESSQYGSPWLAESIVPVCHSFLSWWMVRRSEPMVEQWWGCNCDPGKNSPLFLGHRRSVTSLLPLRLTAHRGAQYSHWQVRQSFILIYIPMWLLLLLWHSKLFFHYLVLWSVLTHFAVVLVPVIMEVITLIYHGAPRMGDMQKHTGAANVLQLTEREACVTISCIDLEMSQRVFITRVYVSVRVGIHASLIRLTVTQFSLSLSRDRRAKTA